MDSKLKIYKQLTTNISCGNTTDGMPHAVVIVNIGSPLCDDSGKPYPKSVQISVPGVELLDSELKKIITKLSEYSNLISSAGNVNIYLHTTDNIQGLLLMVGYHMVKTGVWTADSVVENLDTLLFTTEDHQWERLHSANMARALEDGNLPLYTQYLTEAPKRLFTSNSFKKILMSIKN